MLSRVVISRGFPGGLEVKVSACNAGDPYSIPGLERSPGEEISYPLQRSGLENSMDREGWRATVNGVTKSWTRLRDFQQGLWFFQWSCMDVRVGL